MSITGLEKKLLKHIIRLEKQSATLRRAVCRKKKYRMCLENVTMWIKLITVVASLILLLWTVAPNLTNIK